MRTPSLLIALAAVVFAAAPARAQLSFSPMVGYDIDYEAFMVGLGFELGITPGVLPVQAAIRPSVEYLFLDDEGGDAVSTDLFRVNGDLIGRFSPPAAPLRPYAKAGVGVEIFSVEVLGESETETEVGVNLGAGVLFSNFFVEGTLGLGISDFRVAAGYRF
jgi:hypothetical protein